MHVYSLSLGRETVKRKEYLAVSPGSCSFPAAVQLICPFQHGALLGVDVLPLPNAFSNTSLPQYKFHPLNTTHMETGPGPFLPSLPSPLLGKSYISTEKECTHPVLIRPGKGEGIWQGQSYGSPTHEPGRTEQAGGRHAAAFYMALVLSL